MNKTDSDKLAAIHRSAEINKLEIALGSIPLANQDDRAVLEEKIQTIKEVLNHVS